MNRWMTEEALKWADTFGAVEDGEAPSGSALALDALAREVRRLRADYAAAHKALTLELQQHKRCHEEVLRLAGRLRKYEPGTPMVLA